MIPYMFFLLAAMCAPGAAQNFWQGLNLPNTDAVTAVSFNPLGHVFCATRNSGIYRSTDGGATFLQINNGLANQKILAVAPLSNSELLAGSMGNGFYHSLNNGDTWSEFGGLYTPATVSSILVRPSAPLIAGTYYGLYTSSNGGAFWRDFKNGIGKDSINAVIVNGNGHLFAASSRYGVFRSTNSGTNFSKMTAGLPQAGVICLAVQTDGTLFCGTDGGGLYRSSDNGANWSALSLPGSPAVIRALMISASGKVYAAAAAGVYRSSDAGATWSAVPALSGVSVTAMGQSAAGMICMGTWGGQLFKTTDEGGSWSSSWLFTKTATVHSLYIRQSNNAMYAGVLDDGLFYSSDKGASWRQIPLPAIRFAQLDVKSILYTAGGTLIIGTEMYGMYRSTDGGNSWSQANTGITGAAIYGYALVQKAGGDVYLGTGGKGVFRSPDDGATWIGVNNGLTNPLMSCLAISPAGSILAGTGNSGVFRSTDNGANWSAVNNGLANKAVNTLFFNSDGQLFVGTSGDGLFTSTNEGAVWAKVSPTVTTNAVMTNAINAIGTLFIGTTSGGVYRSKDKGNTWSQVNAGLGLGSGRNINALALDKEGFLYAGTDAGMFASLAATTITTPAISASTATLSFGNVQVNSTGNKQVDISNTGDGALVIDAISITPTGTDFKTTATPPVTIQPGGKSTIPVTFTPKAAGSQSGTLQIHSNDPATALLSIALTGTGTVTPKPKIVITATQLDYGTLILPGARRLAVRVENQGTAQLVISGISLSGSGASRFAVVNAVPMNLAAGAVDSIQIDYNPVVKGSHTAQVDIAHNDADKGTISVSLAGQAINPGSLAALTAALDFGSVRMSDPPVVRSVRFQNSGDVQVAILIQALRGTDSACFQLIRTLPAILAPAGTDSITVSLNPSAALQGSRSAKLVVESDGTSGAHIEIPLTAQILDPVSVEPLAPARGGIVSSYPNPFSGGTRIAFTASSPLRFQVFDLMGKQVLDATDRMRREGEGGYSVELRGAEFPRAGVYLYRILLPAAQGSSAYLTGKICLLR